MAHREAEEPHDHAIARRRRVTQFHFLFVSMNSSPPALRSYVRGFTLVELIVVIAVASVIMSLSIGGLNQSLQSQRLSASATRLAGEHGAATLQAVRENRSLEVRLLRRTLDISPANRLRGVQIFAVEPTTGEARPVGEPIFLDPGVVVLENEVHSTLLKHKSTTIPDGYYTLKASGTTDLDKGATDRWCITLALEEEIKDESSPPPNHRVLVINPHTAAVQLY